MKNHLLRAVLFAACLTARLAAADEAASPPPAPTPPPLSESEKKQEEAIRARLADHALKKANSAGAVATADPGTPITPEKENPTMLMPRVEVNQSRITELAIALHEKDVEIAREKKNIKTTALDDSLNDTAVAHKLAILGGSAAEDRSRLAEERVSLLESERDLIEQIFNARTDEERAALQKQMDELKTMRRQLERAPKDTRGE